VTVCHLVIEKQIFSSPIPDTVFDLHGILAPSRRGNRHPAGEECHWQKAPQNLLLYKETLYTEICNRFFGKCFWSIFIDVLKGTGAIRPKRSSNFNADSLVRDSPS